MPIFSFLIYASQTNPQKLNLFKVRFLDSGNIFYSRMPPLNAKAPLTALKIIVIRDQRRQFTHFLCEFAKYISD